MADEPVPGFDFDPEATIKYDHQLAITIAHAIIFLIFDRAFITCNKPQFQPFKECMGLLRLAIGVSLVSNVIITARHYNGGMQCWFYLSWLLISPAIIANVMTIFSTTLLAKNENERAHKSRIYRLIPTPNRVRRYKTLFFTAGMVFSGATTLAALLQRFGTDMNSPAWSQNCVMDLERWHIMGLFITSSIMLFGTMIAHMFGSLRHLRLAVYTVRIVVICDSATILPFLWFISQDDQYARFQSSHFDVEIFAMLFNLAQTVCLMVIPLLGCLIIDGGTLFGCINIKGIDSSQLSPLDRLVAGKKIKPTSSSSKKKGKDAPGSSIYDDDEDDDEDEIMLDQSHSSTHARASLGQTKLMLLPEDVADVEKVENRVMTKDHLIGVISGIMMFTITRPTHNIKYGEFNSVWDHLVEIYRNYINRPTQEYVIYTDDPDKLMRQTEMLALVTPPQLRAVSPGFERLPPQLVFKTLVEFAATFVKHCQKDLTLDIQLEADDQTMVA